MDKPAVTGREVVYRGKMITVRRDVLDGSAVREIVEHPDAVAMVALDERRRVLLVRQYRHAVGARLLELPAGLLDSADEPPLDAARRELAEEADLAADSWDRLVDMYPSPGFSTERVRIFLARDLHSAGGAHRPDPDEDLETSWLPLDEAVRLVYAGSITNGLAVAGLLAAARVVAGEVSDPVAHP